MRRAVPAVLALLVAMVALSPAAAGAYTPQTLKFKTLVGPDGKTPCTVVGDLYTPDGASAADPAPALLTTNGFGGSKNSNAKLAEAFRKRGYVVLSYSGLGFGNEATSPSPTGEASGCKIELDDRDWDGKAASQLVTFLGGGSTATDSAGKDVRIDYVTKDTVDHDGIRRPDDPRLGMFGGSYGGQIQFAVAGIDSRVDTIIPQITWNDLAYSLAPNNTDLLTGVTYRTPGIEKIGWVNLFFGIGVANGVSGIQSDPSRNVGCPNFDDRACTSKAQLDTLGYPDDATLALARHASVSTFLDRIRIPTLLGQGQTDTLFNLQEAAATFRALRAQGTPVKMIWQSAGHSGGSLGADEVNQTDLESSYESRTFLEWFDYYLRGIGDPPTLDFSYYRDWVAHKAGTDAQPSVASAPSYPTGSARLFYLSGKDALTRDKTAIQAGSAQFTTPPPGAPASYSEIAAVDPGKAPFDGPGTFAAFTTPALAEDLDVVGIPRVSLHLSAPGFAASQTSGNPATKLILFVKLYDVDGAGANPVLVRKLISPIRVADVTAPVAVQLPGIVHRFAAGHRLQLVVAASDLAYKNNNVVGPVAVTVDPRTPDVLVVPRLGTPDANASEAPGGGGVDAGAEGTGLNPTAPQRSGAGGRPAIKAASLPARGSCVSRRGFVIRLARVRRPDRLRSATVTVNGKRVKIVRGRGLRRPITLSRLPRGTFRVVVTVRTVRHRTRRSARTYRAC